MSLQDTISKFQTLPPNIQQALSSDEAMAKMESLENKYNLKLASFVLRAAVREFPFEDLGIIIRKELNLKPEQAGLLKDELLDQIFAPVLDYYTKNDLPDPLLSKEGQGVVESKGENEGVKAPPRPQVAPQSPSPQLSQQPPIQTQSKLPTTNYQLPTPHTPPPQPPKSRSYFYFDAEDEKDVEKFKKHEAVTGGGKKDFLEQIDKAADEVINHSLVNFSDENGKRKLKSYLTAYFRGIRDILQTKESLAKPAANGGMEFDAVAIEKVMALAKEEYRKIHSGSPVEQPSPLGRGEGEGAKEEIKAPPPPPSPQPSPIKGEGAQDTSQITIRRERPQVIDTDKPKIAEVRLPSKLTGPVEEIEQLSLRDLRRFAQNHQGFADRTLERIKILENESFEKRMMGIAAWRKSTLYQQYLSVIQNSLERNISIPEMIGGVSEAESQNMSLREWQTVNRLNRELKS